MPIPSYTGVDADGIETDDDLGTALLQRVDENAQWCRINRAPQPALCFERAVEGGGALVSLRPPTIASAQWTMLGPFPVWVPQGAELRNGDPEAPCTIDVLMAYDVEGDTGVKVCAVSADALPTGFGATWCEDNRTMLYVGTDAYVRLTGVVVRPGVVNRIYIGVRSSITWIDASTDLRILDANGFGRLVGVDGKTLGQVDAVFEHQVPYVAIAPGHTGAADAADAEFARTVALCLYDSDNHKWPSALIADALSPTSFWPADQVSQWDNAKYNGGVRYGTLDRLLVRSVAPDLTNAQDWPDRVNNGALRAFQAAGTNVEQLGWTVNALDQYRQAMAFTVWPRQFYEREPAWPGMWRAFPLDTYPGGSPGVTYRAPFVIGPDRQTGLSLTMMVGVLAQTVRTVGSVSDGASANVRVIVRDASGTQVASTTGTITPPVVVGAPYPLGGYGWTAAWLQLVQRIGSRPAVNEFAFVDGQPWSHDGCVDPRDIASLFAPCEVAVDVSGLTVGTFYDVQVSVQYLGNVASQWSNAVLALGAVYGRLVVGS